MDKSLKTKLRFTIRPQQMAPNPPGPSMGGLIAVGAVVLVGLTVAGLGIAAMVL